MFFYFVFSICGSSLERDVLLTFLLFFSITILPITSSTSTPLSIPHPPITTLLSMNSFFLSFLFCSNPLSTVELGCSFPYYWVLRVLCVLKVIVLYQMCVLPVFSPSLWLLFSFSSHCLSQSRSSSFYWSPIQQLFVSWLCLWCWIIKSSPHPGSPTFSPVLYARSFIVLCFTLRSVIHFDLIFTNHLRSLSRFLFLLMDVQLFQYCLLKRVCCIVLSLLLCQRPVFYIYVGLFTALFFFIDVFA